MTFKNRALLETAFVHKSYINEHRSEGMENNERLEFLGDAVLELVTTEYLFRRFPESGEGELTALRSALVKGKHLANVGAQLEVGKYLYVSRGEEKSGGREKQYIVANTVEALIGALYLDRGFKKSHEFIDKFILKNLGDIVDKKLHIDAKSQFQELTQERLGVTPEYRLLREEGPDHNKIFTMGAFIGEECIAEGGGSSKQKAEQEAAQAALKAKHWDDED
ncbi:MAG: Ribonuclease 3 [Candidatus Peregrinibacteria bacterium GW2011_GWA2_47_7]|nr:MAG: Ribonuclease 3 [Candidatus Peregrinibacteria bacterium GW2011_GWA2_47_7]